MYFVFAFCHAPVMSVLAAVNGVRLSSYCHASVFCYSIELLYESKSYAQDAFLRRQAIHYQINVLSIAMNRMLCLMLASVANDRSAIRVGKYAWRDALLVCLRHRVCLCTSQDVVSLVFCQYLHYSCAARDLEDVGHRGADTSTVTNTNTKYNCDTGQTRNKLLAQWVHLTYHAAGHSRPRTAHLTA